MDGQTIVKIINTLLALLGIWTAQQVSKSLTKVGDAAQTISAGFAGGARK